MKIAHLTPFAPNGCGLYEAARDMVVADILSGHETYLVDTGIGDEPGVVGKKDYRGGSLVESTDRLICDSVDVIIAHTCPPDAWIVSSQVPIIWMLHGRPGACFRPEQFGNRNAFTTMRNLGQWPRVKAMVTFWDHHVKYWEPFLPKEKLFNLSAPPIDRTRFSKNGHTHDFGELGGKWNIMIAESWREDVDIYEVANGALELARRRNDVKFHFYAMETPLRCWDLMLDEFKKLGALGEVWGRRPNIEEVYRAADILLSPQRITTRTVGEALSCGTPVIAELGSPHATYVARIDEPDSVASVTSYAIDEIEHNKDSVLSGVEIMAETMSLERYSEKMKGIYSAVVI